MAEVHGSKLIVLLNAVDITALYHRDDMEFGQGERDLLDRTNYGATNDRHGTSPIAKGIPMNIGGVFSTEMHAVIQPLEGTDTALVIKPAGASVGTPKLSGTVTVTNYKVKSGVTVDAVWSAVLTPNSAMAWGTN
ncbi:MAG: hypothetical protein JWL76_2139 [Thermoleophilia bacterium]|nr:hypothetical protein [Thermoleophilia bacterium]